MSGHSKWATIKRAKEKTDAQRGKIFTKLVREISVSAKLGGPDPATNNRLKDAISKAKQNNMPMESVTKAIKKSALDTDSANFEQINYEGYGIGGSAVIALCLTDNRNRTAGEVRHAFDKHGGSLGQTGSVSFMFDRKGVIVLEKDGLDFESLFDFVVLNNGDDLEENEESFVVYTSPENFPAFVAAVETANYKIINSDIEYLPTNYVSLDENQMKLFEKMLAQLEDNEDVSAVYHNVDLDLAF